MKRAHVHKIRTCKFKVGYLVYWRRNAGKKVESVWKGPSIIIEAKSDRMFVDKCRREVKVMHHDKLKRSESRQLPRLLWLYTQKLSGKDANQDSCGSAVPEEAIPEIARDHGFKVKCCGPRE